jgi:hypothetical protein
MKQPAVWPFESHTTKTPEQADSSAKGWDHAGPKDSDCFFALQSFYFIDPVSLMGDPVSLMGDP